MAYFQSPSPGGLTTLVASGSTAEVIVSGMDATGLTPGSPVQVLIHLWEAMSQPGTAKGAIARLRDGGPAGTVLDSFTFTDAGSDATHGHQQGWVELQTVTPSTDRLCVTIQQTAGAPQITSDWRFLEVVQPPAFLTYTNPTATGNRQLDGSGERVISDMDYAGLQAGDYVSVSMDLWVSQEAPGLTKSMTLRLRDGGPTGTVLASQALGDAGDSSGGHSQRWQHSAGYTLTTGRLCVTAEPNAGNAYSDTRTFTLTPSGSVPPSGTFAVALPKPVINMSGTAPTPGALAVTIPVPALSLAGSAPIPGSLVVSLPVLEVAAAGATPPARSGFGLVLDSTATVTAEPPLEAFPPGPGGVPDPVQHIITPTVPAPTLVNGRPS